MRNPTLISVLVILLVLPVVGSAATLDSLSGTADCNGWSADMSIDFRPGAFFVRLEYFIILRDANGVQLDRFDFSEFVDIPSTSLFTYNFAGSWAVTPTGNCTVTGEFVVHDLFDGGQNVSTDTFVNDLACGGEVDDPVVVEPCLYRAHYWHRHPESWPVDSLEIGGRTLDQDQLLTVMNPRGNQFFVFALTRQLIAARLNLLNGGNRNFQNILDIADAADALLMNFDNNRRNAGQARAEAHRLMRALVRYNKGGCPGGATGVTLSLDDGNNSTFDGMADKAAVELRSLGAIKAMYR